MAARDEMRCYKFTNTSGFFSIIAARDDDAAKNLFIEEYGYSDKKYKETIAVERLSTNSKVRNIHFPYSVSLNTLLNVIRFFPRVVTDSIEFMDSDYHLK